MRWNYQYEKYHYFLNICEQIRISNNYSLNSQETVREALSKPAPSFFLTAQRISRIISETRLNVDGVKTGTYRQNREILRRYFRIKRENP
ncbi:MAG: hypothetical protein LBJ17_05420, partial [Dysgonamonadaceae bacterium]|nr:hypothetical protein [Dysgonamonadaceae bacterium]